MEVQTSTGRGWRQGRALALAELALVIAVFAADRRGLIPVSNTPFLFALGWISLWLRDLQWRDVGFVRPRWLRDLALGGAAGILMELLAVYGTEPWIARAFGSHPDVSDFRSLVGNLQLLLVLQPVNWLLAAFGEELVYRGYLMNRLAGLGDGARGAWLASLIVVSALFGWAHGESQGMAGVAQEGFNGLLLGLLYLGCGRRLAVPIVAHGISNTLAFVLIYLGRYPGV